MWLEEQPHPWIVTVLVRRGQQHFHLESPAACEVFSNHVEAALYWWHVAAVRLSGPPDGHCLNLPLLQKMAGIL